MRLGKLLAAQRKARGLTQVALGEKLNRPQSFVGKYETGQVYLDVIDFIDAASAIGCSIDALVRDLDSQTSFDQEDHAEKKTAPEVRRQHIRR